MNDASYRVTANELRQFIERAEQLASEKKDISEQEKDLFAEAKARGYDPKVMKKVIALRKRDPNDVAEEEAILEMYREALGLEVGQLLRDMLPKDGGGSDGEEDDWSDLI
jgi:uncharacterized protein (UPF0335 family)